MRGTHDARRAVDRRPEEVVLAALVDAGVQPAAHEERDIAGVARIGQRKLQLQYGVHRVEGIAEYGEHPVAGGLDHDATVRFDRLATERVVACQRGAHALGLLLPPLRAALDVGEQVGCNRGALLHAERPRRSGRTGPTVRQPHGGDQRVPCSSSWRQRGPCAPVDQPIAPVDQHEQEVERARAQRCRLLVDEELPRGRAELEATELVGRASWRASVDRE